MKRKTLKLMIFLAAAIVSMITAAVFADEETTQTAVAVNETEENIKSEEADPRGEAAENSYAALDGDALPTEEESPAAVAFDEADENEETEITIYQYEENISDSNQVPITEVYSMFAEDGKEHVIYIGRPTCYYCRQFSPALKAFNALIDNRLEYYNTDSEDFDEEAKHFLYVTLGIPGTPTTIRLQNGRVISAWVGSGISGQELYDHLFYDDTPAARVEADSASGTAETGNKSLESSHTQTPDAALSQDIMDAAQAAPIILDNKSFPKIHVEKNSTVQKKILPHLGMNGNRFSFYGFIISALGFVLLKRTPKNIKER
ncbi:bacteriocin biosynthesis protein [Streptococcus sp. H31]|uniref:bacteriocin biosynthesis protein n=1 Tax=Streptococcus huangxiaojuni TaxID=3237239 RepID=UPI0034A480B7